MTDRPNFTPILLGSDINVYGMARAFYELDHRPVKAMAGVALAPTRFSKLVELEVTPGFNEDPVFIKTLRDYAQKLDPHAAPVMLVSCGDGYSELLAKHKEELQQHFIFPALDYEQLRQLNNKEKFYQIADEHQLPHPKTKIVTLADYRHHDLAHGFHYPIALKPANSVEWLDIHFEGRKKAFIIHEPQEYEDVVAKIYDHGYQSNLIVQDFIPGDDSNMRVLNAYVDQHHRVKMMCLGHPLLEDPTPQSIGNYVTILPEYDQVLYETVQRFLEEIKYVGFANFDMKYDARDGQYKFFEINLRQGRSSFYVTLNGYNLAELLVRDYIRKDLDKEPTVYGNKNKAQRKLWLGIPGYLFKRYAADNEAKHEAEELLRQDRYGTTLYDRHDMSPKRWVLLTYINYNYTRRFRRYFEENKGRDLHH